MKKKKNFFFKKKIIESISLEMPIIKLSFDIVTVHLVSGKEVSVRLKLDDNLAKTRKELAKKDEMKMDDMLSFLGENGIIPFEDESEFNLRDIVSKEGSEKTHHLHLISRGSNEKQL